MKYRKYTKEYIEEAVSKSLTIKECLKNIGIAPKGSNYKSLHKWTKFYNIDISHFEAERVRLEGMRKISKENIIPLEKILVENSSYSRTHLKARLYIVGLKKRNCEICNQDEYWNSRKMSLILDHINGVSDDNRLENLRILCPNCNATLDTHAGKNNKKEKKKYFCKCGELITKTAKNCKLCSAKIKRKVERPSIEMLKEEVKSIGYKKMGIKYGVSDNSIRKWINIPA